MSWYSRIKDWAEGEVLTAEDLDAELDNVAEGLNGFLIADQVVASSGTAISTSLTLIPGTEKTIEVPRASIMRLHLDVDFKLEAFHSENLQLRAALFVDGVEQARFADLRWETGVATSGVVTLGLTASQTWRKKLTTGSHTLAIKAKTVTAPGLAAEVLAPGTGYDYLITPDPEP